MNDHTLDLARRRTSLWSSLSLFVLATGVMGFVRLYLFQNQFIPIAFGPPLLICLWYRDYRLLWSMAAAFIGMSTYKAFVLVPNSQLGVEVMEWAMQVGSVLLLGAVVHWIARLTDRLREKNADLGRTNHELLVREEEIRRQNEELQSQAEELQQQSEELEHQTEELRTQAEELATLNAELRQRQRVLQTVLESFRGHSTDREVLDRICQSLLELFERQAVATSIVEKCENEIVLQAYAGRVEPALQRWPFENSFASVVMAKAKTAYVDDLAERPDMHVFRPRNGTHRSVIASPLELSGSPVGAIQVYADHPRTWTPQEFSMIEWVAGQCSLVLETRRLQSALSALNARLESEVHQRTAELRALVDELEHFSYTITHDLRAPLRAMQGFAQILAEDTDQNLSETSRDYLRRIVTASARMDRLITDALSYTRTGREEMPLGKLDVDLLLRGIIESYPLFQTPRAKIEICGPIPAVIANPAGLTQCLSNLLGNAVKFVEPDRIPRVVVRGELRGELVRISVEDNGIGIDADMLPRVFGMFQRASKKYEGTGIGLALVKKVVERMGGKVGVESEVGRGSRFWLELRAA